MKTCKTCVFWSYEPDDIVGSCGAFKMFWDCAEWTKGGDRLVLKEKYKDQLAFLQDGSDYKAHLLTVGDFGCVRHQEKIASEEGKQ